MNCHIMFCCPLFRVALSMWLYLVKRCHKNKCGIIHHLDRKNVYDSLLIQLSDTGGQLVGT